MLGWEDEKAISWPNGQPLGKIAPNAIFYEAFGEAKTINEWSHDKRALVGSKTISKRLANGWDMERALTEEMVPTQGILFEGENILYWSKHKDCEVAYNTLYRRLKAGMSVKEAMKKK